MQCIQAWNLVNRKKKCSQELNFFKCQSRQQRLADIVYSAIILKAMSDFFLKYCPLSNPKTAQKIPSLWLEGFFCFFFFKGVFEKENPQYT